MIPAGYMAKRVVMRPDWIDAKQVEDIYSVSGCVSREFAKYIDYWQHNGYWLFDNPQVIESLAKEHGLDLAGTRMFYYEVYELEYGEEAREWKPFSPEASFKTNVSKPERSVLAGFDIVTFSVHTSPECSPLSCNSLAKEIKTNRHCLLGSFEEAKAIVETHELPLGEPGPYRIFAVYSVS